MRRGGKGTLSVISHISLTTAGATAPGRSTRSVPRWACTIATLAPIIPRRPTGRRNASSRPPCASGPTPAHTTPSPAVPHICPLKALFKSALYHLGRSWYFCAHGCRRTDACLFDGSARAGATRQRCRDDGGRCGGEVPGERVVGAARATAAARNGRGGASRPATWTARHAGAAPAPLGRSDCGAPGSHAG